MPPCGALISSNLKSFDLGTETQMQITGKYGFETQMVTWL